MTASAPFDPSVFLTLDGWVQLLTLTVLEVVLGIDNIIIISILSGDLPKNQQKRGRRIGLGLAMITRVLLLLALNWITRLTAPFFDLGSHAITGRDLVLFLGGLYLIYKAGKEIRDTIELADERAGTRRRSAKLWTVVLQIILIDIVFSLDSVITAVGMSNRILIMVLAVVIAVLLMLVASDAISAFVNRHVTVKVLALAFLLLVGVALLLDGCGTHIPREYIYAAMGFAVMVELLHMRLRHNQRRMSEED